MYSKPYYVSYQEFSGGPIVLEGPFSDRDRASRLGNRLKAECASELRVSPPYVARSEIEALKKARIYL